MTASRKVTLRAWTVRGLELIFLVEVAAAAYMMLFGERTVLLAGIKIAFREIHKPVSIGVAAFVLRSLLADRPFGPFRLAALPVRRLLAALGVLARQGVTVGDGARLGATAAAALTLIAATQYRYALPGMGARVLLIAAGALAGAALGAGWSALLLGALRRFTARAERIFLGLTFGAAALLALVYFQRAETWGTGPVLHGWLAALLIAGAGAALCFRGVGPLLAAGRFGPAAALGAGLALPLLIFSLASARRDADRREEAKQPHRRVVFISIDTLRADHLGCYGYSRPTSPRLDRLAAGGVRFANAYCPMPTTDPSHLAMLTGYYPRTLGVPVNGPPIGKAGLPSLPEFFRAKGFATAAIVSRAYLGPSSLELNGFEFESAPSPRLSEARAHETFRRAANWLSDHYQQDFFLWVHFFDPHGRYDPPPRYAKLFTADYRGGRSARTWLQEGKKYSPEEIAARVALYDGEIRYTDETVGRLLDYLERLVADAPEPPLVVLVADHGEMLGELQDRFGYAFGHGEFLYQPLVHVPLIFFWPGRLPAGRVEAGQVDHVDLAPTLVELMFPGEPYAGQGHSLVAALRGEMPWPRRQSFSQRRVWLQPTKAFHRGEQYMVLEGADKLIYGTEGGRELFELTSDPREQVNLAEQRPERTAQLLEGGLDWEARTPYTPPRWEAIDDERADTLRGLGYVQ